MKLVLAAIMTMSAGAALAQEVYETNGRRLYCQDRQIGKTGFSVVSSRLDVVGGELKVTAEVKSATCQDGQTWALNNPWEAYNFRVYNAQTQSYDTVNVTSKDFKLNIVNPAGVKVVKAADLAAGETVGTVSFSVEELLTEEQKQQLEEGAQKINFWVLLNGIHEFNSSNGSKVGPARYASARAILSVDVEKQNGRIVVKGR